MPTTSRKSATGRAVSEGAIAIDARVVLADHRRIGAVRLDEGVEGPEILADVRSRLLRQALRQCSCESLFGTFDGLIPASFALA